MNGNHFTAYQSQAEALRAGDRGIVRSRLRRLLTHTDDLQSSGDHLALGATGCQARQLAGACSAMNRPGDLIGG